MKALLAAITLIFSLVAYGEESKDERSSPSFFRFGENRLAVVTSADSDNDATFSMNIEPGCIMVRVKLIEMKPALCTYEIIDSPGGLTMTKMAKQALGIEGNVFEIEFSEKVSKVGNIEVTSRMIDAIKDKEDKANKTATSGKQSN